MKLKRSLVVVEGRELNKKIAYDLLDSAKQSGFETQLITVIDSDDVISGDMRKYFPDYVIWRCPFDYKNNYEVERMLIWVHDHCKITVNVDPVGGRMNTSNKYYQHGLFLRDPILKEHVLPMYTAMTREYVESLIEDGKINYPFVMKPDFGSRGVGITLVRNKNELDAFHPSNGSVYSVEPYVESECDWRVFVVGGIALGAMRKIGDMANERDFRAKSGGRVRWNETDPDVLEEIMDLAVRAASVSGLEYAGVDIIRETSTGKFYVLETNISAGWQNGYYQTTGVSVPDEIIKWCNDRAEYFEKPTYTAVCNYVGSRLKYLPGFAQKIYRDIVNYHLNVERDRERCVSDLFNNDLELGERLLSGYCLVTKYDPTDVEKAQLKGLVKMMEKYEISRYGNFVGKDSGVLSDVIGETALYLAISAKL